MQFQTKVISRLGWPWPLDEAWLLSWFLHFTVLLGTSDAFLVAESHIILTPKMLLSRFLCFVDALVIQVLCLSRGLLFAVKNQLRAFVSVVLAVFVYCLYPTL